MKQNHQTAGEEGNTGETENFSAQVFLSSPVSPVVSGFISHACSVFSLPVSEIHHSIINDRINHDF